MTEPSTSTGKKVLVIDDEPSIISYLVTVLEDRGYATSSATNAEEGLAVARRQRPDLITLDIMMPKRSGVALYQDLKLDSQLGDIPVIIVSAFNRGNDIPPGSFRKVVRDERIPMPEAYMEKPIVLASFLETVTSLIGSAAPMTRANGVETS